ncbi:MAG: YraN family protein [Coriobacteriia bacterium]|nr:YraN family protein [Coriobacteriia bacterium]
MVSDHIELGKRGERAARAFLERHGLDILDTNWACPAGEVDIVAWDGYALRFVEVKTRRGTGKGFPEEAVNADKRTRYERIAEFYLRSFDKVDIPIFFDIIGIVATGEGRAFLRYHRDAFGRDYEQ